jgi:hypothetical protein
MYDKLYAIEEFEAYREKIKKYFEKKYSIDYISINILNRNRDILFFRMDNDNWHQTLKENNWTLNEAPFFMSKIDIIKPNEIYMEYFPSDRMTNVRAEIFGERKYGGCDVIISTNDNDVIIYHITFKNDQALGSFLKDIVNSLIKDLINYRNLFIPFVRYGEMQGDFSDKIALSKHLNRFKNENHLSFEL